MSGQVKMQAESGSAQNATVPTGTGSEKPCRKCGATDRFPKSGRCRPCEKTRHAKYYAENAEKIRATSVKYRAEHPEQIKARKAKYYAENSAYYVKYCAEHSEQIKARAAKYHAEHPEQEKACQAKWNAEHPEQIKAYKAKWQAANPENKRASQHKRRARKRMAGGSFTAADVRTMLKQQKRQCVYCRGDIGETYHIDHVMPLALGGSNGITNIQLLCPPCNMTKNDKHPVDFMRTRGFLL